MKRDLDVYLERREPAWSHEVGWQSRQVCTIPLCKDGAWYAGPLHVNEGPAMRAPCAMPCMPAARARAGLNP